jgi:methylmalonyl-CoA/ethylmalonyl-CoA epimerase
MYGRIHHVGIGVTDLEKTIHLYRDILGFPLERRIGWSNLGLKAALFPIGESRLEFIEAIAPQGEIPQSLADAIRVKDGMVHHLAFTVDHIDEKVQELMAKGIKMINEKPLQTEGGKVAWLAQKAVEGYMIELCEEDYEIR